MSFSSTLHSVFFHVLSTFSFAAPAEAVEKQVSVNVTVRLTIQNRQDHSQSSDSTTGNQRLKRASWEKINTSLFLLMFTCTNICRHSVLRNCCFFSPLPLQNICCVVYYLTCVFLSLAVGLAGLQITWVFWIFVSVVCSQSERVSHADLHRWTKKCQIGCHPLWVITMLLLINSGNMQG